MSVSTHIALIGSDRPHPKFYTSAEEKLEDIRSNINESELLDESVSGDLIKEVQRFIERNTSNYMEYYFYMNRQTRDTLVYLDIIPSLLPIERIMTLEDVPNGKVVINRIPKEPSLADTYIHQLEESVENVRFPEPLPQTIKHQGKYTKKRKYYKKKK